MVPPASQVPQMRAVPRPVPTSQSPAVAPASAAGSPAAAPGQPGLMVWMATTAAGMAVGSATLGHTLTSGFSGGRNVEPSRPDITYQEPQGT
jgi:hypothetical protein